MSDYYQQRQAAREFWRDVTIGILLLTFFSLMLWDIFTPEPFESTDTNVEERCPPELGSLYHNEDSYPVTTRM